MRASWRRSGETTGIRHRPAHYKACTLFSQRRFQQLLEQCFASGSPSRVYTIVIDALALGVYGEADLVDPAPTAGGKQQGLHRCLITKCSVRISVFRVFVWGRVCVYVPLSVCVSVRLSLCVRFSVSHCVHVCKLRTQYVSHNTKHLQQSARKKTKS